MGRQRLARSVALKAAESIAFLSCNPRWMPSSSWLRSACSMDSCACWRHRKSDDIPSKPGFPRVSRPEGHPNRGKSLRLDLSSWAAMPSQRSRRSPTDFRAAALLLTCTPCPWPLDLHSSKLYNEVSELETLAEQHKKNRQNTGKAMKHHETSTCPAAKPCDFL